MLIVDDAIGVAQALRTMLSDEFLVRAASRPLEALALLFSGVWYDVILSDVMMPVMTGIELHGRLHAVRPDLAARIIFMTGGVDDEDVQTRLDALPNLVLEKPLDVDAVRELIRRRLLAEPPVRERLA